MEAFKKFYGKLNLNVSVKVNDFGLCISTVAEKHNLQFSIFMQI